MIINGKFRSVQKTIDRPEQISLNEWREYIADENYRIEERKRIEGEREIEEKINKILSGYEDDQVVAEAVGMELKALLDYSA